MSAIGFACTTTFSQETNIAQARGNVTPKRFCLGDAGVSNDARGTALPLSRGRHTVHALTNGDHSVDSVGSQLQPTQTEQDDTLCMPLDAGAVDGGVSVDDMPSFLDHGDIATNTLINRGMLVARLDDFGEHRLALNPESTYLTSILTVTESCLLPKRTAGATVVSHTLSKLSLVALCIGGSWQRGTLPQYLTADSVRFIQPGIVFQF